MTDAPQTAQMKPMMTIRRGLLDKATTESIIANGIILIECDDPKAFDFIANVPLPASIARDGIDSAAIHFVTDVFSGRVFNEEGQKIAALKFAQILFQDRIQEKINQAVFNGEKQEELRKIAREEARAERAKLKTPKTA